MRKKQAKKRPLLPDPKFNDQLVTRFVNMMMWDGKKSTAFKIFYDAIEIVDEKKTDEEKTALEIWKDALSNVMPHVEVRSRRVGGATFQIPMQIRPGDIPNFPFDCFIKTWPSTMGIKLGVTFKKGFITTGTTIGAFFKMKIISP